MMMDSLSEVLDGKRQWAVVRGHVLDVLREMPEQSVQCVVCSPPYWSLRDYSLPPIVWGDSECEHEWGESGTTSVGRNDEDEATLLRRHEEGHRYGKGSKATDQPREASTGQFCQKCNGWKGSLGLEPTPELYIEHLVEVFREVKRVLRGDGTCWVNMGDSYASQGGSRNYGSSDGETGRGPAVGGTRTAPSSLKPKDQCLIPFRFALAMQADGWWVRSTIIWAKGLSFCPTYSGSVMPESVRDRPTTSHEYVFLFTKKARYFYDAEAVKEPASEQTHSRGPRFHQMNKMVEPGLGIRDNTSFQAATWEKVPSRNLRSVFAINPHPYKGAHFATFPPELVEPMIKAGTSERGCCPACGAPWRRVTEKRPAPHTGQTESQYPDGSTAKRLALLRQASREQGGEYQAHTTTIGWQPGCECDAGEPVPCLVADIFSGAGTSVMVALRLGRRAIGIELNEDYCQMSRKRIIDDNPMFNDPRMAIEEA